jgi:acetolactate synthase-1/2/3 large subunit
VKINGGIALARSLEALGISQVFVLHGGHLDAFLVACKDASIHLTDTRHESTAGHAAEAFARATGGIGVCAITAGPGFTNALTAMADAHLDAAPTLFISSSPPLREVETNALQGGLDQVVTAHSVSKWAPKAVDQILELLAAAERPAIIVGGGPLFSPGAGQELMAFGERTNIPVVYSAKGNGILPADHPNNLRLAGVLSAASFGAKQPPDVVVQLGARAGMSLGGRSGSLISADATLIQVDVDGAEIGRLKTPAVAVVAAGAPLGSVRSRRDA